MRKRSIISFFDNGFWFLVAVLPLVAFVIMLWFNGSSGITLSQVFISCGFDIAVDNVILTSLIALFGSNGVLPLFISTDILVFLSYFIIVDLIHVAVDVLLFIPRFCHKMIENFGGICHEK